MALHFYGVVPPIGAPRGAWEVCMYEFEVHKVEHIPQGTNVDNLLKKARRKRYFENLFAFVSFGI